MDTGILERCIATMSEENGYPPTIRELSKRLGLSVSTIHVGLTELEKAGALVREEKTSRSIKLTQPTSDLRFHAAKIADRLEISDPEAALAMHNLAALIWENGLVWEEGS